jgi:hypothetical protein
VKEREILRLYPENYVMYGCVQGPGNRIIPMDGGIEVRGGRINRFLSDIHPFYAGYTEPG